MSEEFYWIKLGEYFFEDDRMKYLLSQKNGCDYVVFWLKLLLKCLKNKESHGFLRFTEKIPYDDNLLAKVTDTNIDTVRVAMEYFAQLDMIEIMDNDTIYIEEVNKLIGKHSTSTDRVRKHREKKKLLEQKTSIPKQKNKDYETNETFHRVSCNDNKEIELEKEIKKSNKGGRSTQAKVKHLEFVLLTNKEYEKLSREYGESTVTTKISDLNNYIGRTGKKYKSHYYTLINWIKKDLEKVPPPRADKTCPECGEPYKGVGCGCGFYE